MFHPDYFEERARMFRAAERGHLLRRCDECGEQQVCADALPIDDEYKECRFGGMSRVVPGCPMRTVPITSSCVGCATRKEQG